MAERIPHDVEVEVFLSRQDTFSLSFSISMSQKCVFQQVTQEGNFPCSLSEPNLMCKGGKKLVQIRGILKYHTWVNQLVNKKQSGHLEYFHKQKKL